MGGAGTDTAKEAADVLIANDDLRKVPETIGCRNGPTQSSGRTSCWPLGIKVRLPAAGIIRQRDDVDGGVRRHGASLLVVFNGLRLSTVAATWPELQKLTLPTALLDFAHPTPRVWWRCADGGALSGTNESARSPRPLNAARVLPALYGPLQPCAAKSPHAYAAIPCIRSVSPIERASAANP